MLQVAEKIIEAMIVYTENNSKFTGTFSKLELEPNQTV